LGCDRTASGATRIPGSFNYHPHFWPRYPRVLITYSNSDRIVTAAEIEQLGMVAPAENTETKAAACTRRSCDSLRAVSEFASSDPHTHSRHGAPA
jgi:hypothetical protein